MENLGALDFSENIQSSRVFYADSRDTWIVGLPQLRRGVDTKRPWKDSPNLGTGLHTTKSDSRILPLGRFLRKTKINELPQLFNILFGSMSIVGPRPLVDKTFEPYSKNVKKNIYNVKPGLTGIGSIVFRDEEEILSNSKIPLHEFYKNNISPYKGDLELWYQKNLSFYTDLMIIIITAYTIFIPNNNLINVVFKDLPKNNNLWKELF